MRLTSTAIAACLLLAACQPGVTDGDPTDAPNGTPSAVETPDAAPAPSVAPSVAPPNASNPDPEGFLREEEGRVYGWGDGVLGFTRVVSAEMEVPLDGYTTPVQVLSLTGAPGDVSAYKVPLRNVSSKPQPIAVGAFEESVYNHPATVGFSFQPFVIPKGMTEQEAIDEKFIPAVGGSVNLEFTVSFSDGQTHTTTFTVIRSA